METTKNTQTASGDFFTACGHITNSRSLLDLAAEYILSGQDATAEEKLYNILFAVETARDEARRAEGELMNFNPYRLGTAWSKAIEAENEALKAHLVRLEEEKAEAWRRGADKEEAATPPQKITAEELIKGLYIPLWESWSDALLASGERGKLPCKVFSEWSGATEKAPLTFMFLGFCGGYNMGTVLAQREERDA